MQRRVGGEIKVELARSFVRGLRKHRACRQPVVVSHRGRGRQPGDAQLFSSSFNQSANIPCVC